MSVANRVTKEEESQICDYFNNQNLSPKQIGSLLNRDASTVRRVLKKNGIKYNTINYISEDDLNNIITDYHNGLTPKELEKKYHRSDGHLIKLLKSKGIYHDVNNHLSQDEWKEVADLYSKGLNDEIFSLYPTLTINSLYSKMSEMNIRSGLRNYWSDEDKQIVKDLYNDKGIDYIYELINHRHSKNSIESLALQQFGYNKGYYWSSDEDSLFKKVYPNLPVNEVLDLFPNRSLEALRNRAKILGITSYYVLQTYWSDEENQFLIDNWKIMSDVQIGNHINRNPMAVKDRRNLLGLYRIQKEYLGYESIKRLLRARTWVWKQKSMEDCNYQCVLTGDKNFHIHHLYGFNDIFNNFITDKKLLEEDIASYSFDDLEKMCVEFIQYHDTYPLGVCIRKDLHILFHSLYGKNNNRPEQWYEFVRSYNNGNI